MPTETRQTTTTLIFDLTDFVPLGQEKNVLLCLNENTYHVVWNLFQFYGYWLNRYTPDMTLDTWYQPEGEQAVFVHDMYDKGMEELMATTCVTDLVDAINNGFAGLTAALGALNLNCAPQITVQPPNLSFLQEALENMVTVNQFNGCGCGCHSSGSGQSTTSPGGSIPDDLGIPNPFDPSNPGQPTEEGFPPTFATFEQWKDYQCRYANAIIDGAIGVANSWWSTDVMVSVLSIAFAGQGFSAAVAFLAASLGATPYGVLALSTTSVTAIALPILLAAGAIILTLNAIALDDIASILDAARNGIACAMMEAETAADARLGFLDAIEFILTENNVPMDGVIVQVYAALFPEVVFGRLLYDARSEVGTLPLATCDCGDPDPDPDPELGEKCIDDWSVVDMGDLDGFLPQDVGSVSTFPAGADGATFALDSGHLAVTTVTLSGNSWACFTMPPFEPYTVIADDTFCVEFPGLTGSHRWWVFFFNEGALIGEHDSGSDHIVLAQEAYDMTPLIGQTIDQIGFGWAKLAAGVTLPIGDIGINCGDGCGS